MGIRRKQMRDCYRHQVRDGDVVRMPNGLLATVIKWDIVCVGDGRVVYLKPHTNRWRAFWLWFTGKTRFVDKEIDKLALVRRKDGPIRPEEADQPV